MCFMFFFHLHLTYLVKTFECTNFSTSMTVYLPLFLIPARHLHSPALCVCVLPPPYHTMYCSVFKILGCYIAGRFLMIRLKLQFLQSDPQGRSLFLHFTISRLQVPPPFQFAVLQEVVTFKAKHPSVPAIWLGDFNITIKPNHDRISSTAPL